MTTAKSKTLTVVHLGDVNIHIKKEKGIVSVSLHGLSEADYKTIAKKLGKDAVHDFTSGAGTEYRNLEVLAVVDFWPERE